jgi:hypothetical protein
MSLAPDEPSNTWLQTPRPYEANTSFVEYGFATWVVSIQIVRQFVWKYGIYRGNEGTRLLT